MSDYSSSQKYKTNSHGYSGYSSKRGANDATTPNSSNNNNTNLNGNNNSSNSTTNYTSPRTYGGGTHSGTKLYTGSHRSDHKSTGSNYKSHTRSNQNNNSSTGLYTHSSAHNNHKNNHHSPIGSSGHHHQITPNSSSSSLLNKSNRLTPNPLQTNHSNTNDSNTNTNKIIHHTKKNVFREYNVNHRYTPKSYESPQKQWQINHSPFAHDDFKQMDADQQAVVIADYLEKVPLLARLNKNDRYKLGKLFKDVSFESDHVVIRQGDAGDKFYIIKDGEASVIVRNDESKTETEVAVLKPGDYFGETALLTDKPRNATVKAIGNLHTLTLDKQTFIASFGKERVKVNFGKRGAISAEKLLPNAPNGRKLPWRRPSGSNGNNGPNASKTDKDEDTKDLIANAVENNVLFAALDIDQVNRIVEVMWQLNVPRGTNLINQGEPGDNFYVVEKGIFDIYVQRSETDRSGQLVSTRTSGESFGELALMYNSPRSATVTARTDCKVWAVERYMFRKILIRVSEDKLQEYERFLAKVPLLDSLLTNERRAVAEALDEVHFKKGDIIVEQGEPGDTFYILKKGEATVTKRERWDQPPKEVLRLQPGDFFGERALVKNEARAATVTVVNGPMTCLSLDREAFCLLLGPLAELMHRKIDREYDGIKSPRFANNINNSHRQQGHLHAGSNGIRSNQMNMTGNNNNIRNGTNNREAGSSTNGNYLTANSNGLMSGNNLTTPNAGRKDSAETSEPEAKKAEEKPSHILDIKQSELTRIGVLGKGSFGSVELVKHAASKRTFALKSVAKAEIVKTGQQEHIISEKNVMIMLDSRFIVKLFQTYNDSKYLYFLLEVVLGGELFTVLRQRTVFDESTARFYAGSVVCAFGYMHEKNVIYRDLKPENLLLDTNGYLKITDFGFAKIITDRTYTLCGTPDYLAPEVISGAGHGKGVDWWTLGILLFEMLASYPPFYDEDPMRTYAKIMYGKVKYPKHFSHDAVEIIKGFLTAKATKRLGVIKGGTDKIEEYKWFSKFDWNSLKNGTMKAPIVPTVSGIEDRSNFEVYEDDEEIDDNYHDDGTGWDKDF